jgi:hypothetical protein
VLRVIMAELGEAQAVGVENLDEDVNRDEVTLNK